MIAATVRPTAPPITPFLRAAAFCFASSFSFLPSARRQFHTRAAGSILCSGIGAPEDWGPANGVSYTGIEENRAPTPVAHTHAPPGNLRLPSRPRLGPGRD